MTEIKYSNKNNLQSIDLTDQEAVREFFRNKWHRPKKKGNKINVKMVNINGKMVEIKSKSKFSDDENSKKLCRAGIHKREQSSAGELILIWNIGRSWIKQSVDPLFRGEILNEELRRLKGDLEKHEANSQDVDAAETVRLKSYISLLRLFI